jgi:hypothetical protein
MPIRPAAIRRIQRLRTLRLAAVVLAATALLAGRGSTGAGILTAAGSDPAVQYASACAVTDCRASPSRPQARSAIDDPPGVDTQPPAFRDAQGAGAKLLGSDRDSDRPTASRDAQPLSSSPAACESTGSRRSPIQPVAAAPKPRKRDRRSRPLALARDTTTTATARRQTRHRDLRLRTSSTHPAAHDQTPAKQTRAAATGAAACV